MKRVGVFIDGSNVFWGCKREGWKIDYDGLKRHLDEKYAPALLRYYGVIDVAPRIHKTDIKPGAQMKFYTLLESMGYEVVLKPLKYIEEGGGIYKTKGDMDIELSMDIFGTYQDLDHIVLVSGDSDYLAVLEYLYKNEKTVTVYSCKKNLSWELSKFCKTKPGCDLVLFDQIKDKIELTE